MKNLYKAIVIMVFFLCATGPASAAVFIEGEVTRAPWEDTYQRIEVDKVVYTVMPDVKIMLNQDRGGNMPGETERQLRSIRKGTTLWMSIEGNRVYQIWEEK